MGLLRALLVSVLVASAASATPRADHVVVALGDSLTAGLGVGVEEAYPALLEARLRREGFDYRVVNAGVSGDTSAGGLRRLDWALKLKPQVLIVALGANDGLRGQPPATLRANLTQIVERARAAGARVLPNYGDEYARAFAAVYASVARATGVPLAPFLLDGVAGDPRLNQADGIHPTAEGQRVIAEHLWPHLRPLLAK